MENLEDKIHDTLITNTGIKGKLGVAQDNLSKALGGVGKYWKHTLSILLLLVALGTGIYLVQSRQLLKTRASGENSAIDLAVGSNNSINVSSNQIFEVPVMVNTDNAEILAADIVINFDKSFLELNDIVRKAEGTTLTKFLPRNSADNFDKVRVMQSANSSGVVDFGALAYSGNQNPTGFNGLLGPSNPLAILKFKALKDGNTSINVAFQSGATNDSNLVARTSADLLGRANNLNVIIGGVPTPTPTFAAGTRTITLTSIDDGYAINGFGHNETSSNLRIGGNKYDAGFRFAIPIPVGSEILSARLSIPLISTSSNTGAITNIKAERATNSNSLTGSNPFVTVRSFFANSVNWPIPSNNQNSYVNSPDIKVLIQDLVNQNGWVTNNFALIALLKTADTQYANLGSLESSPQKSTQLVITYRVIPPTPTPTPTLTPTPIPTSTPTPSAASVLISTIDDGYSIDGFGHNEDDIKIRTGANKYDAGFRFPLNIPAGSQILEAKLKVSLNYSGSPTATVIKAERVLDASPLSGGSPFVAGRSYFDNGVNWNISGNGIEVSSPDIKGLIQNVVNQSGWQSGNKILIALLKSGTAYADMFSLEKETNKAAKLTVTYK